VPFNHREIRLQEANPLAGVFQNIDPPPPSPPGECVHAFGAGGRHTRWVERGVGGQYFGRRQAQLCILCMYSKYFVHLIKQNYLLRELLRPLSPVTSILGGTRAPRLPDRLPPASSSSPSPSITSSCNKKQMIIDDREGPPFLVKTIKKDDTE
jgi:hypothetical protein